MSNYKTVEFDEVSYVDYSYGQLILRPKYIIDGKELSDTLSISYGKIESENICHLKEAVEKGIISNKDYERVRDLIMAEINEWCRNLGLIEVTEKI